MPSFIQSFISRTSSSARTVRLSVGLVLALGLSAPHAAADQASTAQALFEAASNARDAGDFRTACEKFEASLELDRAAGTTLNIADCREQLGQLAQAWQRYVEAAERLSDSDPRAKYAESKAQQLKSRLPLVTLSWGAQDRPGTVFLDGVALPSSAIGLALPVDPGKHTYLVQAEGRDDAKFDIEIKEAERKNLTLELGPIQKEDDPGHPALKPPAKAAPPADQLTLDSNSNTGWSKSTWGWASVGVGAASLAVGGVTGLMALSRANTVDDNCDDDFCINTEGKKAADSGRTLATISTLTFVAGGVLAAAGVTLLLLDTRSDETAVSSYSSKPRPRGVQVRLESSFAASSLSLTGQF